MLSRRHGGAHPDARPACCEMHLSLGYGQMGQSSGQGCMKKKTTKCGRFRVICQLNSAGSDDTFNDEMTSHTEVDYPIVGNVARLLRNEANCNGSILENGKKKNAN